MRIIFKPLLSLIVASIYLNVTSTETYAQTAVKKTTVTAKTTAKPTAKELEEGKNLMATLDCMACHKLDTKLIGPHYQEIAKKYPATETNYNLLSQKIIKGGSGVWGNIPMAPHASLKADDAKKLVKYILSIK